MWDASNVIEHRAGATLPDVFSTQIREVAKQRKGKK